MDHNLKTNILQSIYQKNWDELYSLWNHHQHDKDFLYFFHVSLLGSADLDILNLSLKNHWISDEFIDPENYNSFLHTCSTFLNKMSTLGQAQQHELLKWLGAQNNKTEKTPSSIGGFAAICTGIYSDFVLINDNLMEFDFIVNEVNHKPLQIFDPLLMKAASLGAHTILKTYLNSFSPSSAKDSFLGILFQHAWRAEKGNCIYLIKELMDSQNQDLYIHSKDYINEALLHWGSDPKNQADHKSPTYDLFNNMVCSSHWEEDEIKKIARLAVKAKDSFIFNSLYNYLKDISPSYYNILKRLQSQMNPEIKNNFEKIKNYHHLNQNLTTQSNIHKTKKI